ncbi:MULTISPECIES: hypothetical protein [unclassified Sphingomonas]|uniref:hypothetical protein n=1 Tax=unclassified Sphingomonas TaxID=196159 RepID=UPI0022B453E3|nr:hypothetical protein [Sphingomonas sp. NIBR02145]WHU01547.1 hypothetical protein O3305_15230 [Sphingomonas sp. NIBR02145]
MSDRLIALPNWQFALLPAAQLLVCLFGWQLLLGSLLCNSSPWTSLSVAAGLLWCLAAASLPLGFVAIGLRQFRLSYLVLVVLGTVTLAAQQLLIGQGLLRCNWF